MTFQDHPGKNSSLISFLYHMTSLSMSKADPDEAIAALVLML